VIYVAFILTFLSTLNFGAGILDGLIGGLFISAELRALKEFKWEVRTARRLASVAAGNSKDALGDDDEDL
jgi:sphingomyelin phosphodiesterase 2